MESKPLLSLILIFAILAGFSFAATDVSTCANISSPGSYVLNQSINGTGSAVTGISNISYACIRINSSNVAFDCNGFNISGNGSQTAGIAVNGSATSPLTNITIKNCPMIFNYSNGVVIQYANLSVIQNVTSTGRCVCN